jgi:replicative DNA helicase
VFDQMAGRYSQSGGPNLGVYLKGHVGDLLKVDRRGRPPEYVERPCLTIGLAVQPEVLRGLASRPGFRGRGLLARFLSASRPAWSAADRPAPYPSRRR